MTVLQGREAKQRCREAAGVRCDSDGDGGSVAEEDGDADGSELEESARGDGGERLAAKEAKKIAAKGNKGRGRAAEKGEKKAPTDASPAPRGRLTWVPDRLAAKAGDPG